jgi:hypothetical protein
VAGSIEVVAAPGDPDADDGAGSILRFTPSGPLPANTTFDVELAPGVATSDGGGLAGPLRWTFTTGAPLSVVSNRITFLSDRSGVANVWSMNPDGTAPRQLSVELQPVLDYAIAPDGSSIVVADGRHLIFSRADGGERRVLTQDGLFEFDPTYAPNGQRVAFGRADAATGEGLGLWEWEIGAGDATPIELPPELDGAPSASGEAGASALRAPRYAPDGQALAFVDLDGWVGLLELPAERLTRVAFRAGAAPMWLPDSGAVLLNGTVVDDAHSPPYEAPIGPLEAGSGDSVFRLARSATDVEATDLERGFAVIAIAADGSIAYVDRAGSLWVATRLDRLPDAPLIDGETVGGAAFAPGEEAMVVIVGDAGASGRVELLELQGGRRTTLAQTGSRPRWLP